MKAQLYDLPSCHPSLFHSPQACSRVLSGTGASLQTGGRLLKVDVDLGENLNINTNIQIEMNDHHTQSQKKILIAGATGYLGKYVVKEFKKRGYYVRALARGESRLDSIRPFIDEAWIGEITDPSTLRGVCHGMDYVFSSVGITRQKDGLSYMDVDYGGNRNLLDEALKSKISSFMYISGFNAEKLSRLKIVNAKERFASELKSSGMNYVIVRPNGFFSDMEELLKMARKGKVSLFGKGNYLINPIHGADLASFCSQEIGGRNLELDIGGPDTLTHRQIALQAFTALGSTSKITYTPVFVTRIILFLMRAFTSPKTYGPVEFFMNVMTMDMTAPEYGTRSLGEYYRSLTSLEKNHTK